MQNLIAKTFATLLFAAELKSESLVMRGFEKDITLGCRTSGSFHNVGLQNRVAKKFAKFLHLSWDLSQGS